MNKPEKKKIIVKMIPPQEIQEWKKFFSLHGTKADFQTKKKISAVTIGRVIKSKKASMRVINAIRSHVKKESATA